MVPGDEIHSFLRSDISKWGDEGREVSVHPVEKISDEANNGRIGRIDGIDDSLERRGSENVSEMDIGHLDDIFAFPSGWEVFDVHGLISDDYIRGIVKTIHVHENGCDDDYFTEQDKRDILPSNPETEDRDPREDEENEIVEKHAESYGCDEIESSGKWIIIIVRDHRGREKGRREDDDDRPDDYPDLFGRLEKMDEGKSDTSIYREHHEEENGRKRDEDRNGIHRLRGL